MVIKRLCLERMVTGHREIVYLAGRALPSSRRPTTRVTVVDVGWSLSPDS
jgi:hypothetical protein